MYSRIGEINSERNIGKDLKNSGCQVLEVPSRHALGWTEEYQDRQREE